MNGTTPLVRPSTPVRRGLGPSLGPTFLSGSGAGPSARAALLSDAAIAQPSVTVARFVQILLESVPIHAELSEIRAWWE
ncbi:MAG: hypothetical protein QOE66_2750, partial [Chloroflexota bacterium]|nr:hypothetical protein [Chloroflexota bacterium]